MSIRYLKTAYGDFLDLQDRVVGDFFDDRGADGNIRNSILEVHRYAPQPSDLEALQRFSSLAPNSTARPQKRRLEQDANRAIPSIEEWDAEAIVPYGSAAKRQRTHKSGLNRTFDPQQKVATRKEQEAGVYHSSQTSGTQNSVHQVVDSQKSPGKKRTSCLSHCYIVILIYYLDPNPYGTPTSLPFSGLQEPVLNNEIDVSAISDSPLGSETISGGGALGGARQLNRKSTKSESPELRLSVGEVPHEDPTNTRDDQPIEPPNPKKPSPARCINNSAPHQQQELPISQNVDDNPQNHTLGFRQTQGTVANFNPTPKRRALTANAAHVQNLQRHSDTLRESDPIFDPIESDTESFNEKQQMQSAKRLRSSRTPTAIVKSLSTLNNAGTDRKDGQFLVPSLPQSRTNEARKPSGGFTNPERRGKIEVTGRDFADANKNIQNVSEQNGKHDAKASENAHYKPGNNDPPGIDSEMAKRNIVCNGLVDTTPNSSQATTSSSQDPNEVAYGIAESVVQHRDIGESIGNKDLHQTIRSGQDVNSAISNRSESRFAQEAERLTEEAADHQERSPAQEAVGMRVAANEKVAERKSKEEMLSDQKTLEEGKVRDDEPARAKKAGEKEVELTKAKRVDEARANEARLSGEKGISEGLARKRQPKGTLAEEPNRLILAADGAKQAETEKKEKEKARREELAAKKKANYAKAAEQAREAQGKDGDKEARNNQSAREDAQTPHHDTNQTFRARTVQETATAVREQALKRLAAQEAQKLRNSSGAQSRASTNPPIFSNSEGSKRSMTPYVPGSSVMGSSPRLNSLTSSPLENRGAPLRSALRQTPSLLRRSISSVSFDLPPRAKFKEYDPSTPITNSLSETSKELAVKPSSMTKFSKDEHNIVSNVPPKTPVKTPIPKKAAQGKIMKVPAKIGKVQTTLNVTRQSKKLKGRVINPTVPAKQAPKQAPKQEIVISSGDEFSSPEEPKWQTGNAVAGPSSRKPIFPVSSSQGKKIPEPKPSGTSIKSTMRNVKIEKNNTAASAGLSPSTSKSASTSLQQSTSRSPAIAVSETISVSSGSSSESDSNDEPQAPSSKTPVGIKNGKPAPVSTKGVSEAVNVGIKQQGGYLKSATSSQSSSQASSSRPRSIVPAARDSKQLDQAANKQLQLESRESITKPGTKQVSSTTNSGVNGKVINQGLDHAGRLPNGIRPANYKYPTLSELQKLDRAVTPRVEPKSEASSSQPTDASLVGNSESSESSSDSDESSSTSDDDHVVEECPSQTEPKQQSRPYPGMKGLIKGKLSRMWRV